MRVFVLNPPFLNKRFSRSSRSPAVTKSGTLYYPLWLAAVTGLLEDCGFDVRFVDAPASGATLSDVVAAAEEHKPDLVVVETTTPSIYSDLEAAAAVKQAVGTPYTVLCGTHASALPEETMAMAPHVDAIAHGECDDTIADLAEALKAGASPASVPGLTVRDDNALVRTARRELRRDLDALPFLSKVYKRHLDVRNYFFAAAHYPVVQILTARGCPYGCFFCVYPQTYTLRQYRKRSPEHVVEEFLWVQRELPHVKEIGLEDDTFTVDRKRVQAICELLIARGSKIPWYCNARADVPREILRLMRKAGCRMMAVGFESASQSVLDGMHKGIKVEQIKQFARDARREGLLIHGCFMVGNPGDTPETLEQGLQLAKELNTDTMQFFPLMVYPGTEAYRWASENGYLRTADYASWVDPEGMHNCVIDLPGLSAEELVAFCDRARREYYLRGRYIAAKLLTLATHPSEVRRTLMSARTFIPHLLRRNGRVEPQRECVG